MPFFCIPFTACNRQVDSLDRRQTNLQNVPADIDRYARSLEELLLDMNHIKELPKGLFRLHKLRRLGLSDNDIYRVPPEVASLMSLVELNLSRNDISDIPEQLRECKELMVLDLSSNPITRLPATISQLTSLTHLGLNDVSLTQLPADIGLLVNMRSLEVRENLIRSLPQSICQLTKLQLLDIGQNEIEQLPSEMGNMQSLKALYVDSNDLESLPDQICLCRHLEQVDVSENKLMLLPEDIGDLENLTDLDVSQNCLQIFPNSIGRLKRLNILKAEKNTITSLTMSIGSCEHLQELVLTDNLLTEIPSSIGNLHELTILNVDKNQLSSIPTTIGGCHSLSVLSLRDNRIAELPMDIGKCERLTVLDLCSNRLSYLPFTLNVLFKLQALWLSENQSQAMLKLQQDRDPRTGVKVLTCYLLPQQSAVQQDPDKSASRSFVGGPKVHFGDQDASQDDEGKIPIGNFERHDTPHPKPHAAKLKKNTIDGHIIHHDEEQSGRPPPTFALTKKNSESGSPPAAPPPQPQPRSALRFQSTPPSQYTPEAVSSSQDSQEGNGRSVAFASVSPQEEGQSRLKRINTPHVRRGEKDRWTRRIRIIRDDNGGLGLSIAGGLESTPFRDGDRGLFISRVVPGGPAEQAGLKVGDKLLRVNDTDVVNVPHETAVRAMQGSRTVEMSILRIDDEKIVGTTSPIPVVNSPLHTPDVSISEADMSRETVSTTLKRDSSGSPGFTLGGGIGAGRDGIFISHITPGGAADRDGKLMVGDRVLSIDGTKMRDVRHDQAVALLTGHAEKELHLVVQRDRPSLLSPLPPSSLPSTSHSTSLRSPSPASTPVYNLGDTSWDNKVETVELVRDGTSLGLSVVGGADHASHPFGVTSPGVFISKIASGSPAARSKRLRVGDRILYVNSTDVRDAKHAVAVEALKTSGSRVRLQVSHDPQPSGMKEVIVRRKGDGQLGMSIHGGVHSPPAIREDDKDEGIFIEKIEPNGLSDLAGLVTGMRIVEVNGESLLGASQIEAANALKRGNELRILVCDGYNRKPDSTRVSPILSSHGIDHSIDHVDLSSSPLASSSPLPPPAKIPPPVAPKPAVRPASLIPQQIRGDAPERLPFSSKIQQFEHRATENGHGRMPIPEKKPLLNEEDIRRLKEDKKTVHPQQVLSSPGDEEDFIGQIEEKLKGPGSFRTKKAENRAIAAGEIPVMDGLSEADRKTIEAAKREKWRQERYQSLNQKMSEADAVLETLVTPILNSIHEDGDGPKDDIHFADE